MPFFCDSNILKKIGCILKINGRSLFAISHVIKRKMLRNRTAATFTLLPLFLILSIIYSNLDMPPVKIMYAETLMLF